MGKVVACVAASLLIGGAPVADACGDKLVPVGGSLRVGRISRAAHPGTVFVLTGPGSEAAKSASAELVAGLTRSGHIARVMASAEELQLAMRDGAPDIVLAQGNDVPALLTSVDAIPGAPIVVRVLLRPSRSDLQRAQSLGGCLASIPEWGVAPVVRVVNSIRAAQAAGRTIECNQSARLKS